MERNKEQDQGGTFPAKELEKSNSSVITKNLRTAFGLCKIYAMHVTRISVCRIAKERKEKDTNDELLQGENLNGSKLTKKI